MKKPNDLFMDIAVLFVVFALGFVFCRTVLADVEGSVGVYQSIYTDEAASEWSFGGRLGHSSTPAYLVASYEGPDVKILGQPMGSMDIFTVGLGAPHEVSEGFSLYIEGGWAFIDLAKNDAIVQEVAYTWLVGRHGVEGPVIPVDFCYKHCFSSSYDVDDGFTARIGGTWDITEHWAISGSYKWTYLDQEITIFDPEKRANGGGYWREDETLDLSSVEIGVMYNF